MNYSEIGSRAAWRRALDPAEGPIRAELFSVERLEQHAGSLAAAQRVSEDPERGRPLASRLGENAKVLAETYRVIVQATRLDSPFRPPPNGCSTISMSSTSRSARSGPTCRPATTASCPRWRRAISKGIPRVFGIAWAFVAHTDSRFDPETLRRFVRAYQRVQPLTIGELWAVAITLRVVLVENLRRVADAIARSREARAARPTRSPMQLLGR